MLLAPQRATRQRQCVLEAVQMLNHPTCEEIFSTVKQHLPSISLGTVYRNVNQLVASGQIARLNLPGQESRFDCVITPHSHMLCQTCQSVLDFEPQGLNKTLQSEAKALGFAMEGVSLVLYGQCETCRKAELNQRKGDN